MPSQKDQEPVVNVIKTKELFSWSAPIRPFKKQTKQFYTTIASVSVLLCIIFYLIQGLMSVFVILSLVFVTYVFSTVPPENVEHKITSKGVMFAGKLYLWEELIRFWFAQRFGASLLEIEATRLPGRLEMVINEADKIKIENILRSYVEMEEGKPTFMDKGAAWLSKHVPLES